MSTIKVVKKRPVPEVRLINDGSPFKRFAVVRVAGKNQHTFRAWFDTWQEAQDTATEYASGEHKGLYFVLEVQSGVGMPGEFERKLPDIERNHITNVLARRALNPIHNAPDIKI